MNEDRVCVGCGAVVPALSGDTTLISQLGWRLHRTPLPSGELVFEWRCPTCWAVFKANREAKG